LGGPFSCKPASPMPHRRGMLIKNVAERPLSVRLANRQIDLEPGDEVLVTAEEVRDAALRDHLQVRTLAVVRPSTAEEDADLVQRLREASRA